MHGGDDTISSEVLFGSEVTVELTVKRCFGYGDRCQDGEMRTGEVCLSFEKKRI